MSEWVTAWCEWVSRSMRWVVSHSMMWVSESQHEVGEWVAEWGGWVSRSIRLVSESQHEVGEWVAAWGGWVSRSMRLVSESQHKVGEWVTAWAGWIQHFSTILHCNIPNKLAILFLSIRIFCISITIVKYRQCKARRERLTPDQSEVPSPTLPTHGTKEENGKNSRRRKGSEILRLIKIHWPCS